MREEVLLVNHDEHFEHWVSQPIVVVKRQEQRELGEKKVSDVTVDELTEIITRSVLANMNVPRYESRDTKVGKILDGVHDIGHTVVDVAEGVARKLLDVAFWRKRL